MQFDTAESDGIKSDLRIRCPKSSDFGSKPDESADRTIKSQNCIGLQSSKNLTEQSPGQQYIELLAVSGSASSDRCVGL